MKGRRSFNQAKAESNSVRMAKQRNASVRADLAEKLRLIEEEKHNVIGKYQRREDALEKRLADVRYTRSMPLLLLNMIHLQRRLTSHDVSMNIANCYLMHQEKAMKKLKAAAEGRSVGGGGGGGGEGPSAAAVPKNLDRKVLRHARFIRNAFEEAYNITADISWTYGYDRSADIYEYGRTGHDLLCPSVKDAPVGVRTGAYPQFKAVNVAAYDGRKVEGTGKSPQVTVKVQPPAQRKKSPLPPAIQGGKQPPENKPTKVARTPSSVRPRLMLYMRKRYTKA